MYRGQRAGLREIGPRIGAAGFLENIGETRMDVLCTRDRHFPFWSAD
jgi:hypothetical protein